MQSATPMSGLLSVNQIKIALTPPPMPTDLSALTADGSREPARGLAERSVELLGEPSIVGKALRRALERAVLRGYRRLRFAVRAARGLALAEREDRPARRAGERTERSVVVHLRLGCTNEPLTRSVSADFIGLTVYPVPCDARLHAHIRSSHARSRARRLSSRRGLQQALRSWVRRRDHDAHTTRRRDGL